MLRLVVIKQFIFLPVTPWREQPESHTGIRGAIGKKVDKAQGDATDMWNKLGAADRDSIANKIYRCLAVMSAMSPLQSKANQSRQYLACVCLACCHDTP